MTYRYLCLALASAAFLSVSAFGSHSDSPTHMKTSIFSLEDGSHAELRYPTAVSPLLPFEISLKADKPGTFTILTQGRRHTIDPGKNLQLRWSGPEGVRPLQVIHGQHCLGEIQIILKASTHFNVAGLSPFFDQMRDTVSQHRREWQRRGRRFHLNHPWIRDNIHEMKGYKYWDDDPGSWIDVWLELQHDDGFFYEIIGSSNHDHLPLVDPKHKRIEPDEDLAWIRLEIEADIEYLMVEAAYTDWQATGNMDALRRRLPGLEKGLRYLMTDPTRWDAKRQAVKRTFTIDTWDFTYGVADADTNRRIQPHMAMGIMHGDNSGLYQACRQLACLYKVVENEPKSKQWDQEALALRERINTLCYNGTFYTHQILLQPVNTGLQEKEILSLSNAYDINRGLPTHEMAVRIIDEYQRRRQLRKKTHFAEWFSIDPPYPQFGRYSAGEYINGGIASFVAGELAKAAFNEGRENYAADILRRLVDKVKTDGAIFFLYTPDGRNQGGGPSGWGAAAVISALFEGLAGIRDESHLFESLTVSPRFVAAEIDHADVCARYGSSGAYVAMRYDHDRSSQIITVALAGVAKHTTLRILLPPEAIHARVISPIPTQYSLSAVQESQYLTCPLTTPLSETVVEIVVQYDAR